MYRVVGDNSVITTSNFIGTVTGTQFTDSNTDLSYNTVYKYAIVASCSLGDSGFSNTDSGYLKTPLPTVFTLTAQQATNTDYIGLSWTPSAYADNYIIYRNSSQINFAATNYLRYSEDLAVGSYWKTLGSITVENNTDIQFPNSSVPSKLGGRKITFSPSGNTGIYQTLTELPPSLLENPITYTVSVYAIVKPGSKADPADPSNNLGKFRFVYNNGRQNLYSEDLIATDTLQRFTWTFDIDTLLPNSYVGIVNALANTGDVIYFWGAQLEKGNTATGLVSTTNSYKLANTYSDYTANPGTKYSYYIEAINNTGIRTSNPYIGYLKTKAPTNLVASTDNQSRIDLTWDGVAGATTYRIYRSDDGGSTYSYLDMI